MTIFDLHCDALMKLSQSKGALSFYDAPELDVNFSRLKEGGVKLQAFALFVYPSLTIEAQFVEILAQVDHFYRSILEKNPKMRLIKKWSDLSTLQEDEIGALLTLEGVDCIGNDLHKLTLLHQLGVRSIGLTWNGANLAADGVAEPRNGGLTRFGRQIISFNNEHQLFTDLSHLGEVSSLEALEVAEYPIASHSNVRAICDHRRNLSDRVIEALIAKGGMTHLVFYPHFVSQKGAVIEDLFPHIDHLLSLGGENHIGFGSDFDGIEDKVEHLRHAGEYPNLIKALSDRYGVERVEKFASQNFIEMLKRWGLI